MYLGIPLDHSVSPNSSHLLALLLYEARWAAQQAYLIWPCDMAVHITYWDLQNSDQFAIRPSSIFGEIELLVREFGPQLENSAN